MNRVTSFNKLYIKANGSIYWNNFCNLSITSSNLYRTYLRINNERHTSWDLYTTMKAHTQHVNIALYSKIFKM
jgi:hypothetical protein